MFFPKQTTVFVEGPPSHVAVCASSGYSGNSGSGGGKCYLQLYLCFLQGAGKLLALRPASEILARVQKMQSRGWVLHTV